MKSVTEGLNLHWRVFIESFPEEEIFTLGAEGQIIQEELACKRRGKTIPGNRNYTENSRVQEFTTSEVPEGLSVDYRKQVGREGREMVPRPHKAWPSGQQKEFQILLLLQWVDFESFSAERDKKDMPRFVVLDLENKSKGDKVVFPCYLLVPSDSSYLKKLILNS